MTHPTHHLFLYLSLLAASSAQAFDLHTLRVEYTDTPLGIDTPSPRFSWQMQSDVNGTRQSAYQISLLDPSGREVWNSGRTSTSEALGIAYQGPQLAPETRYDWHLIVWDEHDHSAQSSSWFETGLQCQSDTAPAWGGAQWIGGGPEALTFDSQYLPVFRLQWQVMLDAKSHTTEASFLYGGNDHRLLNPNKNILGTAAQRDGSYIQVSLNVAPLAVGDSASLDVYRIGYTSADRPDQPLARLKVSPQLLNAANQYQPHTVEAAAVYGVTRFYLDSSSQPLGEVNLNPMGRGGDYITFPVVGDVGYSVPKGQKATFSDVRVRNYRDPFGTLCLLTPAPLIVTSTTALQTPQGAGAPMLRTTFDSSKPVRSARIYATARGIYELFVNGQRVSDDYFNPGLTQYEQTHHYQTFDVTSLIQSGANALGAQLNEGWWSGAFSFEGSNWNFWGDRQSLLAKLVITYTDGSQQVIVTRPDTWQYSLAGPVRLGSFFQGEIYDATREAAYAGWSTAQYQPGADWLPCHEVQLEGTIAHAEPEGIFAWPCPDDYSHYQLTAQIGLPVRHNRTIQAQSLEEVRPGVYLYDMGQNMAGVPRITFHHLQPGQRVYIRLAEVRYPSLPDYAGNEGMVMMENLRGAMHQDLYIARGGETEVYQPRYTYHGYQYVELTTSAPADPYRPSTLQSLPAPAEVEGIVLSSVDAVAADFTSSNPLLNRFFRNVEWSSLANIFSVPTDCPQRNERMGWSGDLSVFSPTMSYMFNGASFLRRHLTALRNGMDERGNFPAIAPSAGGFGGTLWSSVGIAMPWQSFVQYNDLEAIREHYPAMQRFIECILTTHINPTDHDYRGSGTFDLGDWLGFEVNKNDNPLLFDCYLVYELQIMERVARALGHEADAQEYARQRQVRIDFINDHYIDPVTCQTIAAGFQGTGHLGMGQFGKAKGTLVDAQTSYALPLAFGIVRPEYRERFIENFVRSIERQSVGDDGVTYPSHSLMTGFIGTAWISLALSEAGRTDVAYRLLLNETFPSWLYPVSQGATTIWERVNSYTHEQGFGGNNSMNSFNHYAFGSVTNWLMQRTLGIAPDPASPGFHHFILRPEPDPNGGLTYARGHYDSMYGRIESSWQRLDDGTFSYQFHLPANTSATLILPSGKTFELESGLHEITE